MISYKGVTKRYRAARSNALSDFSLDVAPGEVVALVGPNGAGKSTAIRIGAGMIRASAGEVDIDGFEIFQKKVEASRRIGWVSDNPSFDRVRRVGETLRFLARFDGLSGTHLSEAEHEILEEFGIATKRDARVGELSQGMIRRFAIACAAISNPQNYLLDEVFNNLDKSGIEATREWILKKRDSGCAILLSTHQLAELREVADRLVILSEGKAIRVVSSSAFQVRTGKAIRVQITLDRVDPEAISVLSKFGSLQSTRGRTILLELGDFTATEAIRGILEAGLKIHSFDDHPDEIEYLLSS